MASPMYRFHSFVTTSAVVIALCAGTAYTGLIVQGTCVVFPVSECEVTLRVSNTSGAPVLTQAWIDDGRQDVPPGELQVPFSVTPAATRVDPNGSAVLCTAYPKAPLPTDRELLFWLNTLEVPPRDEDGNNALQFSFRLRFKLSFRPSQLKSVDSAAGKLQWKFLESGGAGRKTVIQANNPTLYYASFASAELIVDGCVMSMGKGMVVPLSTKEFDWQGNLKNMETVSARYEVINDHGGRSTLDRAPGK